MDRKGDFEFLDLKIGRRKNDYSSTSMMIFGDSSEHLEGIVDEVMRLGAVMSEANEVEYEAVSRDMVLPDDFSTTNHPTNVYLGGGWVEVEGLMMDKQIVVDPVAKRAWCEPISLMKRSDLVVKGEKG